MSNIKVRVAGITRGNFIVDKGLKETSTILELKNAICDMQGLTIDFIRVLYNGKELASNTHYKTLKDIGI